MTAVLGPSVKFAPWEPQLRGKERQGFFDWGEGLWTARDVIAEFEAYQRRQWTRS